MNAKTVQAPPVAKRKRGRPSRGDALSREIVTDQAAAYGISVPILDDKSDRFLTPNDIGKILNVTGEAVKQWIYRRKLPAVKLANGYWKVKVTDFEGFLKARTEIGRRQVLITDGGNAGSADIVKAIEELGQQATVAHNYADALLKALDHFPALFIICVSPNDPGCWKFAEKIRSNKSLRSFPILFIGGNSISEAETDQALKYYAQGILTHPLNGDVLKKEIDRILKRGGVMRQGILR